VTAALKNIPKGENEVRGQLSPTGNASLGQFTLSVTGTAKQGNKEYTVTAPPFVLAIAQPFDLRVEPAVVRLTPGGKAKAKVTVVRKGSYQGPIELELRNLPANVTAPKATIGMGQAAVEMEITAAPNAAVAKKGGILVQGTGTGMPPVFSPNLTIQVVKE
jgi:hypothetical protein